MDNNNNNNQIFEKSDFFRTSYEKWEFCPQKWLWKAGEHNFHFLTKGSELIFKTDDHILLRIMSTCPTYRNKALQAQLWNIKDQDESSSEDSDSDSDNEKKGLEYELQDCFYLTPDLDPDNTYTNPKKMSMVPIHFRFCENFDVLEGKQLRKKGWSAVDFLPGCFVKDGEGEDLITQGTPPKNTDLLAYFDSDSVECLIHAEEKFSSKKTSGSSFDAVDDPPKLWEKFHKVEVNLFKDDFEQAGINLSMVGEYVQVAAGSLNMKFTVYPEYASFFLDKIAKIYSSLPKRIPPLILTQLGFNEASEFDLFNTVIWNPNRQSTQQLSLPQLESTFNFTVWSSSDFSQEEQGLSFVQMMKKSLYFKARFVWNCPQHFHFLFHPFASKQPLQFQQLLPNTFKIGDKIKWAESAIKALRTRKFEQKIAVDSVDSQNQMTFTNVPNLSYFFLLTWDSQFSKLCKKEITPRLPKSKVSFRARNITLL